MTVKIKGEIGIDVLGTQFSEFMSRLDGEVNVEIDSPGGYLSDGITIANALRDYNKGKVNVRVVGQASSMAAYIMLFGDTLSFTPNAIVCLHNPWNVCIGDYKAMEKSADLLKRFAGLYAKRFVEKGIFKEDEIRSIMDAETYFIGADDLARLGTVEKSDAENPDEPVTEEDKETAIILAQEKIKACKSKIQASYNEDLEKVAALLQQAPATTRALKTNVQKPASDSIVQKKGEKEMNANDIKSQHPDVYADIVKSGAEQEKARINALMTFIDIDKETVVKAIAEGKSIHDDEVYAKLTMAKINQNTIKGMQDENPADVNPKEPSHAKENDGAEPGGDKEETPEEKAAKEQAEKEAEAKQLNNVLARLGIEVK